MTWFKLSKNELQLSIYVKPNAKKTAILKADEKYLHIAIHAQPKEGEANQELFTFLAKYFNIPKIQISLLRGTHSRYKVLLISLDTKNKIRDEIIVKLLPIKNGF